MFSLLLQLKPIVKQFNFKVKCYFLTIQFSMQFNRHAKINNHIPAEFAKTYMEKLEKNAA